MARGKTVIFPVPGRNSNFPPYQLKMGMANIIWRRIRKNHLLSPRKSTTKLEGKIVNFSLPDRNSIFRPYLLQICVATQKWYWPRKIVANTHRISTSKFGSNLAIKIAQFKTLEPFTDGWPFRGYAYQPRVTRVVTDSITGKTQGIIGYSKGHDCCSSSGFVCNSYSRSSGITRNPIIRCWPNQIHYLPRIGPHWPKILPCRLSESVPDSRSSSRFTYRFPS